MNRPEALETPRRVLDSRRKAIFSALGDGVLVLPAAPVQFSSRDGERPYAPDRELFYATGATEPETLAVLVGGKKARLVMFVRERDAEAELWYGARLGPEGAAERFKPDECHPLSEIPKRLPELLRAGQSIHYRLGRGDAVERHVLEALTFRRARGARTGTGPTSLADPGAILDDLRVVKDAHEIALLKKAAEVSVAGHRAAAAAIAEGAGEWTVEAALQAAFRAGGGGGPAYESIVGSGDHACVLHYVDNAGIIGKDDLVLVDAGAEYGLYSGDITRTYPASGRFAGAQRDVYDIVEAARAAAVEAVRPGATVGDVHTAATRVLVKGLVSLGVLKGRVDKLIAEEKHKPFSPHQTSHWLGLDVHDPGDYARGGLSRMLEPGMVFTVEPGLYFRRGHEATPPSLAGIGVRVEDEVLVTKKGCEVLTRALPTSPDEVSALVAAVANR